MPFKNTQLIPRGLADHFAPTVLESMSAHVRLRPPEQVEVRDVDTGKTTFQPAPAYYDGPGRVQGRGGSGPVTAPSDRKVASGGYLVTVPHTVTQAAAGHLVEVVDDPEDPALPGLVLVIEDAPAATVILQRNLSCTLHKGARTGT